MIIGAFFEVYNELGYGFVESIYQRAMPVALETKGIASTREVPITVCYRGVTVGDFRADLVVEDKVIVEIKAAEKILPVYETQLLNYLKATGLQVGLILNFGPHANFRRLIRSAPSRPSPSLRG